DPESRAYVQPAGRTRRDFGHRAPGVHRSDPRPLAPRRAGVRGFARGAGLSDAGRRIPEDRCVSATATLVVELVTEELPPKALKRLSGAFSTSLADHLRSRGF